MRLELILILACILLLNVVIIWAAVTILCVQQITPRGQARHRRTR